MQIPYEMIIGFRYLKAKRLKRGISFTTLISIAGVTIGVAALIATLAIMTGFKEELQEKILGIHSHIVIHDRTQEGLSNVEPLISKVTQIPGVVAATPFFFRQVLLSSNAGAFGVVLRGIDPDRESQVTKIEENLVAGKLSYLAQPERFHKDRAALTDQKAGAQTASSTSPRPGMIIGKELADRLDLFLGDPVHLISPVGLQQGDNPIHFTPKIRTFVVTGLFDSGMYEYDSAMAYIHLKEAQKFFNMGTTVSGIEVRVEAVNAAEQIATSIEQKLGFPYEARDWLRMNRNLFSALKLEKIVMFIILILITLVASFNIVSTLTMTVLEKGREIAILKAMGASAKSIMRIFMLEGIIIGAIGVAIGLPLGLSICALLVRYYTFPSDVYYISHLPVHVLPADIFWVSISALLIGFLATIYPSRQAAKLPPVEALRYE